MPTNTYTVIVLEDLWKKMSSGNHLLPRSSRPYLPPLLKSLHSAEPPPQLSRPEITSISRLFSIGICTCHFLYFIRHISHKHTRMLQLYVNFFFVFQLRLAGPKEWLKEQKKKSFKFLLAPVDASRNILQSAYLLLSTFFSQLLSFLLMPI